MREGRLEEIDDWDNGGLSLPKSIAEEAIGKVKDLIQRAKLSNDTPDNE